MKNCICCKPCFYMFLRHLFSGYFRVWDHRWSRKGTQKYKTRHTISLFFRGGSFRDPIGSFSLHSRTLPGSFRVHCGRMDINGFRFPFGFHFGLIFHRVGVTCSNVDFASIFHRCWMDFVSIFHFFPIQSSLRSRTSRSFFFFVSFTFCAEIHVFRILFFSVFFPIFGDTGFCIFSRARLDTSVGEHFRAFRDLSRTLFCGSPADYVWHLCRRHTVACIRPSPGPGAGVLPLAT